MKIMLIQSLVGICRWRNVDNWEYVDTSNDEPSLQSCVRQIWTCMFILGYPFKGLKSDMGTFQR